MSDESTTESHGGRAGPDIGAEDVERVRGTTERTLGVSETSSGGPIRHEVEVMAHAMEHKLRENDHKGGWELVSIDELFDLLIGEVDELREAIRCGNFIDIMLEAADVANYAMMIAWNSMKGKLK